MNALQSNHYSVIAPLIMCEGLGDGKTTACVMAQAATIDALRNGKTLDAPTDKMECACPLLRTLAINANDCDWWKNDLDRTDYLRPLIPLLLDSRGTGELEMKRKFFIFDNCVRVLIPLRLQLIADNSGNEIMRAKIAENIEVIRAIPPIVDMAAHSVARDTCNGLVRSFTDIDDDGYKAAEVTMEIFLFPFPGIIFCKVYRDAARDVFYEYEESDVNATWVEVGKLRDAFLSMFRECAALTL